MLDKIIDILKRTQELSGWKVIEDKTSAEELFFIRDKIEMNRAKDVTAYHVALYRDFDEKGVSMRGSADVAIHPSMSGEEMRSTIRQGLLGAGFVKNPWYPLVGKTGTCDAVRQESDLDAIAAGLGGLPHAGKSWLSTLEIFLNKTERRIVNSEGVDVAFAFPHGMLEMIATSQGVKEEVELFDDFRFSSVTTEKIMAAVDDLMRLVDERADASPTPCVKEMPVILNGVPVPTFMHYFVSHSSAENKFKRHTTKEVGDRFTRDGDPGDPVTLRIDPLLPGASNTLAYDRDGMRLEAVSLIEDGRLRRLWGDTRFSHYLKIEPTGGLTNVAFSPGDKTCDELRASPCLELVSFSDFQMDPLTGDFGGEIRLGWHHENGKRKAVTGGSISGNMNDCGGRLMLSRETMLKDHYLGPQAVRMTGVNVAGVA